MTHGPDRYWCQNLELINNISIDIPFIPKAEVTNLVDTCWCLDCGRKTVLETGLIKGASLGTPDHCRPLEDERQLKGAADLFGLFGIDVYSKSTIRHAPEVADRMRAKAEEIAVWMTAKKDPMDETPMPVTSGDRPGVAGRRRLPALQEFGTLQRCWEHISCKSMSHISIAEIIPGISSTHCCDI